MALTRKALTAMGLTAEQVDSIIEMHTDTVDGLKAYKADAEKLIEVQKQLDEANKKLENADGDDYKAKYEALVQENQQKEVRAAKTAALTALIGEIGLSEKGKTLALKYTDLDKVELDGDKVKNAAAVKEGLLSDWGDYKTTTNTTGANVPTPPGGAGGNPPPTMTKEQIMAITDRQERRMAIARNPELFGGSTNNKTEP